MAKKIDFYADARKASGSLIITIPARYSKALQLQDGDHLHLIAEKVGGLQSEDWRSHRFADQQESRQR